MKDTELRPAFVGHPSQTDLVLNCDLSQEGRAYQHHYEPYRDHKELFDTTLIQDKDWQV